jgi:hypothetical protein
MTPSLTLFTHTPFPITYAFYAFCYTISLNINTEELSRYGAKVVPVSEITDEHPLIRRTIGDSNNNALFFS